jgi:hypothetical protein
MLKPMGRGGICIYIIHMTPLLTWALGLPNPLSMGPGAVLHSYHSNDKNLTLSCVFCIAGQKIVKALKRYRSVNGLLMLQRFPYGVIR